MASQLSPRLYRNDYLPFRVRCDVRASRRGGPRLGSLEHARLALPITLRVDVRQDRTDAVLGVGPSGRARLGRGVRSRRVESEAAPHLGGQLDPSAHDAYPIESDESR